MQWHDDPDRDYRKRYLLPKHWLLNDESPFAVDYAGYTKAVLSLVPCPDANARARPRVLDAGCGDGFISGKLIELGYDVVGADYSERAVGFARVLVPEAKFLCLDLRELTEHLEFKGQFDLVISVEVIEHLPSEYQPLLCRNLVWALKEGGQLVISVPSIHIRQNAAHYKHFRLEEIHDLVRQAGLTPEKTLLQNRLSFLNSNTTWKLVRNRCYDLVFLRHAMRRLFLKRFNLGRDGEKVGRYIVSCRKLLPTAAKT